MSVSFLRPSLNVEQRKRIKILCARNNWRGFVLICVDYCWIGFACWLSLGLSFYFYPLSLVIIGVRQRALASLLHEAAHGTLFQAKVLNIMIGRVFCGWPILQSLRTYRLSHVATHHPKIGNQLFDPDYKYMLECGVYDEKSRARFFYRFVVMPFFGILSPRYVYFLIRDRFIFALDKKGERLEVLGIAIFHFFVFCMAIWAGFLKELLIFWWLPFLIIHPIVGWLSELSEHYPMMSSKNDVQVFYSRNRYAGFIERLFVGMHGDHFHLTHHLLPGVPHWNLAAATKILREDQAFRMWDDYWGGIFSSNSNDRISLIRFILDEWQSLPVLPSNH